MKQTIAELACLGLLLIGTAGVVVGLFVGDHLQLEITSLFAAVVAAACIAKSLLPEAPATGAEEFLLPPS
ncbi:MAG TPA: hypothetical protein VHE09_16310 [Rhizomicrobium sp.]|nr:hypothetical protein [Rhizomicrobium sp.]